MTRLPFSTQSAFDTREIRTAHDVQDMRAAVRAMSNALGAAFDDQKRADARVAAAAAAVLLRTPRTRPAPAEPCPACGVLVPRAPGAPWPPLHDCGPGSARED